MLGIVVDSLVVESATYAEEADESPSGRKILDLLDTIGSNTLRHEELKQLTLSAAFVIRTGEFTPYMNICLVAGVPF